MRGAREGAGEVAAERRASKSTGWRGLEALMHPTPQGGGAGRGKHHLCAFPAPSLPTTKTARLCTEPPIWVHLKGAQTLPPPIPALHPFWRHPGGVLGSSWHLVVCLQCLLPPWGALWGAPAVCGWCQGGRAVIGIGRTWVPVGLAWWTSPALALSLTRSLSGGGLRQQALGSPR